MFIKTQQKAIAAFVWIGLCLVLSIGDLKAQCTGVSVSDSLALVDLYSFTNGADWYNSDNWLGQTVAEWNGVELTTDGCHIRAINLDGNNLTGQLPDLNLPNLEVLDLGFNDIDLGVPDFSNMPSLKLLSLRFNNLWEAIPNFSGMPNLEELYLDANLLWGPISRF